MSLFRLTAVVRSINDEIVELCVRERRAQGCLASWRDAAGAVSHCRHKLAVNRYSQLLTLDTQGEAVVLLEAKLLRK